MKSSDFTLREYHFQESQGLFGAPSTTSDLRDAFRIEFLVYNNGVAHPRNTKVAHPHKWTRQEIHNWKGVRNSYSYPGRYQAQYSYEKGCFGGFARFDTFSPNTTALYNECLGKLYERLRGSIDLSIDIGQRQQTIALARKIATTVAYVRSHPIGALRKSYQYFISNKRKPTRIVKDASSLWLEYTYGLKPTVQTVFDAAVELSRSQEPLMRIRVRAKDRTINRVLYPGSYASWATEISDQDHSIRYQIEAQYRHGARFTETLSKFSSLNPISIAWEMMPFSFVADWFYDVGGYMRNLESSIVFGSLFDSGFTTYTYRFVHKGHVIGSYSDPGGYQNIDWVGSQSRTGLDRQILTGSPVPLIPKFTTDLSSGRLLNAAALLAQFFRG